MLRLTVAAAQPANCVNPDNIVAEVNPVGLFLQVYAMIIGSPGVPVSKERCGDIFRAPSQNISTGNPRYRNS